MMNGRCLKSIEIDETKLDEYAIHARDAAFLAGLAYFPSNDKTNPDYNTVKFLGYTLLPSPFLRSEFDYAVDLQIEWNILMHALANRPDIIYDAMKEIIKLDDFFAKLWEIYTESLEDGKKQMITLNIMRCDYFLDRNKLDNLNLNKTALSQVEYNTLGCGGTATPSKILEFRKYMLKKMKKFEYIDKLVPNQIYENCVNSLIKTWRLYGNAKAKFAMIVGEKFYLYRFLEYRLLELEPELDFVRLTLTDFHKHGQLDDQNRLLLDGKEVGLVYYIAAFDPKDYPTENEWQARLMIERSVAIKAPKIEYQFLDTKRFQQYLYETDVMEKLLPDKSKVQKIRDTFVKQFSFGNGHNAELVDQVKNNYANLVLKPQREGGGNNIYGVNIKNLVEGVTDELELNKYTLMERIRPVEHFNYIVKQGSVIKRSKVVTEIGIFGISLIDGNNEIVLNEYAGFTYNTKEYDCDEGGITTGYAGYDTMFFGELT